MEKEFEKLIAAVKQFKLSPEERKKMRENLSLFIQEHPVREMVDSRPQLQQRSWNLYPLRLKPMPVFAVVAAIVLVVGGGTSFAAESSLPGDALYKVKVGVNEEVRAALAVSDEAKAHLAADLAERRLEEAAMLAARGRLSAETQAEIEARFKTHLDKFEKSANKLTAKGRAKSAAELSSNLEASLKAHGQILNSFKLDAETDAKTAVQVKTLPLVKAIQVGLGTVERTRVDAETEVSTEAKADVEAAAEGKLKAATNKIAEVRAQIERTRGSVSASTTAEAEARLKLAEEAVIKGKAKLEADAFAEAFASFDRAHRLAREAQILINGAQRFKIDIKSDSDIKVESKYGCPTPRPGMPNWICPDGSIGGPVCEDRNWILKQCPVKIEEASTQAETSSQGQGGFWLNLGF